LKRVNSISLSICIATYNRGKFIGETLESIICQATEQVEIVVLDGASTDNTEQLVRGYQARFPRLRYFRQDRNMGVDHDFAQAVALARGTYCWLFSDDDFLMPGAIQTVLDALQDDYAVIVANAEVRSADMSKLIVPKLLAFTGNRTYRSNDRQRFMVELAGYMTFIGCVIIKREVWRLREKEKYFGSYFIHAGVIFQSPLSEDALAVAEPLISIRFGNATWHARYFEIWMFKWPELVWSFVDYPDSVKLQVCRREPWRRLRTLLLHRARGTYTTEAYSQWLECRLESQWSRAVSKAIAYVPGRVANFMALVYYSAFYRRPDQPLVLVDLMSSPFFCGRMPWGNPSATQPSTVST
jgi:abequosyltransferase